jgi:hypothetical protein
MDSQLDSGHFLQQKLSAGSPRTLLELSQSSAAAPPGPPQSSPRPLYAVVFPHFFTLFPTGSRPCVPNWAPGISCSKPLYAAAFSPPVLDSFSRGAGPGPPLRIVSFSVFHTVIYVRFRDYSTSFAPPLRCNNKLAKLRKGPLARSSMKKNG